MSGVTLSVTSSRSQRPDSHGNDTADVRKGESAKRSPRDAFENLTMIVQQSQSALGSLTGSSPSASSVHKSGRQIARTLRARATSAGSPQPRTTVQKRMDAFLAAAKATYRVNGRDVQVSPAFRMSQGYGLRADEALAKLFDKLPPKVAREVWPRRGKLVVGKGTPQEIQRVTQALINVGELKHFPAHTVEKAIRNMQFAFGIGLDCSGYAYQAARHAVGQPSRVGVNEAIPFPLRSKDPRTARPGDLIVLAGTGGGPGHKVVVYSHTTRRENDPPPQISNRPTIDPEFVRGGPVHVFEVDSSWGGGPGGDYGGVQRRVWLFNESSHRWAYFSQYEAERFTVSRAEAYDHRIVGVFGPGRDRR